MTDMANESAIGRLLEEISWEGSRVRGYRDGGRGLENVLTTEVFMLLDFLPRRDFLGSVIGAAHGADDVRRTLIAEAEQAAIGVLPGDVVLAGADIKVQPDVEIVTESVSVLVEAKRIKASVFGPDQLAREYLALVQAADTRAPLLLVVLGAPPPIRVRKGGLVQIEDAIAASLLGIRASTTGVSENTDALMASLPERLAWITWAEIQDVVAKVASRRSVEGSDQRAISRLAAALVTSIEWHS